MEKRVDLHIHTTASDGSEDPVQAVRLARETGLSAIAITDHDSVSGIAAALDAGATLGVEVVPGIEISAEYLGRHAHILGLLIDHTDPVLRPVLDWAVNERVRRNEKIVAAMAADGFDISIEELTAENPGSLLGRPHMAEHLYRKGYVSSIQEAFQLYLGDDCPYYLPKERFPLPDAAAIIRQAGGIAVIAHPLQYGYDETELLAYLDTCHRAGCSGLEAYYSEHTPEERDYLLALAGSRGLVVSGGSDWHGTRKPQIQMGTGIEGNLSVPYAVLEGLRAALGR